MTTTKANVKLCRSPYVVIKLNVFTFSSDCESCQNGIFSNRQQPLPYPVLFRYCYITSLVTIFLIKKTRSGHILGKEEVMNEPRPMSQRSGHAIR